MIYIGICNYAGGLAAFSPPKYWSMFAEQETFCSCDACQSLPADRPERELYSVPVTGDSPTARNVRAEIAAGHYIFPVRLWLK